MEEKTSTNNILSNSINSLIVHTDPVGVVSGVFFEVKIVFVTQKYVRGIELRAETDHHIDEIINCELKMQGY